MSTAEQHNAQLTGQVKIPEVVRQVVEHARNSSPPKENEPKCRYCNAQPIEIFVWRYPVQTPEGILLVHLVCCKKCDRELGTTVVLADPRRPIETAGGLILP